MYKSPDIDRGWAYVVMVGYFMTRFLVLGMSLSPGILYSELLAYFEEIPTKVALAINFNPFVTYMSASIASASIRAVGCRLTMLIGCLFCVPGLAVTSFAPNIIIVLIFYGIITGFGFSLINVASYPVVTSYFVKHRDLVLLLASAGEGVGQFAIPYLFSALAEAYSWRGALIVIAGLDLNFLVIAASFMPPRLHPTEDKVEEVEKTSADKRVADEGLVSVSSTLSTLKASFLDDLVLWHDLNFVLLFISYILIASGYMGTMTHVKTSGLQRGLTELAATTLLSFLGLFSLLGTGIIALFLKYSSLHVLVMNALANIGIGVFTIIFAFMSGLNAFFVVIAIIGTFSGCLATFPVTILSVVGVHNIAPGIGYTSMGIAFGVFSGGPIGAALYEADPTYVSSYVTLGALCTIGALLQLFIHKRLDLK